MSIENQRKMLTLRLLLASTRSDTEDVIKNEINALTNTSDIKQFSARAAQLLANNLDAT